MIKAIKGVSTLVIEQACIQGGGHAEGAKIYGCDRCLKFMCPLLLILRCLLELVLCLVRIKCRLNRWPLGAIALTAPGVAVLV